MNIKTRIMMLAVIALVAIAAAIPIQQFVAARAARGGATQNTALVPATLVSPSQTTPDSDTPLGTQALNAGTTLPTTTTSPSSNTIQPSTDTMMATNRIPAFDHIFVIVEENHSAKQIIGNPAAPYINRLASQHGLATNYSAVSHPSLPNYLSLIGGDTFGITSDCTTCFIHAPNLVDRLEDAGRTWKAYMEDLPAPCYLGNAGNLYAQKHDPFIYFDDIRTDATRCNKIVPYGQLASDLLTSFTTPNFVWITPNLCNDMHDCDVSTGDQWLQTNVKTILNSPAWKMQNSLLIITWDEGSGASIHVATLVIAPSARARFTSARAYNHYSLLRTIEQAWSMIPLTANDGRATPMRDFWP